VRQGTLGGVRREQWSLWENQVREIGFLGGYGRTHVVCGVRGVVVVGLLLIVIIVFVREFGTVLCECRCSVGRICDRIRGFGRTHVVWGVRGVVVARGVVIVEKALLVC
jgi:hypothetical protein